MKSKIKKRFLVATPVIVALYFVSFAVLAHDGGYLWVRSGHFRPINHLAMTDILVWQPRIGRFYQFRTANGDDTYQRDWVGCFYSPLILLHQRWLAPSLRTVAADGSAPIQRGFFPARHQMHPSVQHEIPELEQTVGLTWEQFAAKFTSGQ